MIIVDSPPLVRLTEQEGYLVLRFAAQLSTASPLWESVARYIAAHHDCSFNDIQYRPYDGTIAAGWAVLIDSRTCDLDHSAVSN